MTRIPLMDLGRLHGSIRSEIDAAIDLVIEQSSFIGGDVVRDFEEAFGKAHDLPPGAGCASGTDALALALRALGVGPGDEVVVPGMTFVATAEAVLHVGATPVLADVDPSTLLMTPDTVKPVLSERTKAVIPVHLYGHVVPFDHIDTWKDQGLLVVEDCAQAHLASWQGESVGTHGDVACFSFYPGKNLGALGDGGMVLSTSTDVVTQVRRLRDHGRQSKYFHDVPGWCSRLDGIQAAVLNVKLRHLESWTRNRRTLAAEYQARIADLLVPWEEGAVHHLLVARVANPDALARVLDDKGIGTGRHYPVALSDQPWLADRRLPNSEAAAAEVLSLPLDPLMTQAEVALVVRSLGEHI